ncbi:type VI secretion system baseplate subunit TssE [Candidatus Thiosymbion oneisti]|uniref:type VI secretion system baseplate subunit TssE n=1 Tax=Candidatus Thiosymbion oneisti TaxID=589554 RepID=UPI000A9F0F40|nr:type VI secretion system baseplate subunit TssE [Candidatus Thiosymbion oneisti]
MAELIPKERLQPSLLDRLTDDEPRQDKESREQRVLSPRQLRSSVIRDLQWLLNAVDLASVQDLSPYPYVVDSVLNYGLPDLAGKNVSGLEVGSLEKGLKDIIQRFEPRILPDSLEVRAVVDADSMSHNAVRFDIEGELWGQPLPQQLYLKTEVDLESGAFEVSER